MPTLTRYVAAVHEQTIYREPSWAPQRHPTGARFNIALRSDRTAIWGEQVYTWDALKASLCLQAQKTGQTVTVATRDTRYGQEIVTVELAIPQVEVAGHAE